MTPLGSVSSCLAAGEQGDEKSERAPYEPPAGQTLTPLNNKGDKDQIYSAQAWMTQAL